MERLDSNMAKEKSKQRPERYTFEMQMIDLAKDVELCGYVRSMEFNNRRQVVGGCAIGTRTCHDAFRYHAQCPVYQEAERRWRRIDYHANKSKHL